MPHRVVAHEQEHLYTEAPATDEATRVALAVLHLWRAEHQQTVNAVSWSGLSTVDLTALRYLVQGYRDGHDLSPKDLIVMLKSSSATVTNVIERLVSQQLIARVQHPSDRRAHYLVPTAEAIARVDGAFGPSHEALVRVADSLSAEEAECAADVISKIAHALDQTHMG